MGEHELKRLRELIAERDGLRAEVERLQAFRDAVSRNIVENAGNLQNPFAYIWQAKWTEIKAAKAAGKE